MSRCRPTWGTPSWDGRAAALAERVLTALAVVPFVVGATAASASASSDDPAAPAESSVELTFADPQVVESSGLAVVDGLFVTVNDSGDSGRVFTVDPADGYTVGVTYWDDVPTDVEALAPAGPGRVWVGDIGDNREARDSVEVLAVPVGRGDRTVQPERHELVYPDGAHDAETLLAHPVTGQLLVVTKEVFGGTVYAAPQPLGEGPNPLVPVGDVLGIATDGAFTPDGDHVVLRDYTRAVVYTWPALETVGTVRLPAQEQGEGLAVDAEGHVFTSTEGRGSDVLRVRLPTEVREAMAGDAPPATTTTSQRFPETISREGRELPEAAPAERSAWPWFLSGWLAVAFLAVLLRSMHRR